MRVGLIGWRGMVGSVLRERMEAEGDLAGLEVGYFSTSNPGGEGPDGAPLLDARDVGALSGFDALVSCQGGDYTKATHPALRGAGWRGTWIDAASALRMAPGSTIVLDPINGAAIRAAIQRSDRAGVGLDLIGSNCTVGLMLMGLAGLVRSGHVEWISTMSYQSASGAGARHLRELIAQMRYLGDAAGALLDEPSSAALAIDRRVGQALSEPGFPSADFGAPLAASALPWIDRPVADGQTREEWKSMAEANKILGRESDPLPIDGICVRIGALRCHAQALTIKLDTALPLDEVAGWIEEAHPWSEVVPNTPEATLARLTPAATAGGLRVPVGRLRRMTLGPEFLAAFTVGDQLLWGAAEPLRRALRILREERGD